MSNIIFSKFKQGLVDFLEKSQTIGEIIPELGTVSDFYYNKKTNITQVQVSGNWYSLKIVKEIYFNKWFNKIIKNSKINHNNSTLLWTLYDDNLSGVNKEILTEFANYFSIKFFSEIKPGELKKNNSISLVDKFYTTLSAIETILRK